MNSTTNDPNQSSIYISKSMEYIHTFNDSWHIKHHRYQSSRYFNWTRYCDIIIPLTHVTSSLKEKERKIATQTQIKRKHPKNRCTLWVSMNKLNALQVLLELRKKESALVLSYMRWRWLQSNECRHQNCDCLGLNSWTTDDLLLLLL